MVPPGRFVTYEVTIVLPAFRTGIHCPGSLWVRATVPIGERTHMNAQRRWCLYGSLLLADLWCPLVLSPRDRVERLNGQ